MTEWTFVTADDELLHSVLAGQPTALGHPWPRSYWRRSSLDGKVGVLLSQNGVHPRRPCAIIVSEDASRRLFGRYAQLRSDLSPLSAWTHLLGWDQFELLDTDSRWPDLAGFEASWVGLAIAEALMLSERPLPHLKVAACLATPTYAIARSRAMWPSDSVSAALSRYDQCHRLVRTGEPVQTKLRGNLMEIWEVLTSVSIPVPRTMSHESREIVQSLQNLRKTRAQKGDETQAILSPLDIPQAGRLRSLETMSPEMRVREFDQLVTDIEVLSTSDRRLGRQLLYLAGYLSTVAAGGAPSLGLAERVSGRWPQIAAWAYVIGGVGETATWTSSFDGMGRLVARELMRPLRLDDPPACDFALSEAIVLVDRALQDPLVHLRVKQSRVLSVALMPGVNVAIPVGEAAAERPKASPLTQTQEALPQWRSDNALQALADALFPYLLERLRDSPRGGLVGASRRSSRGGSPKREGRLPLDDEIERPR